MLSQNVKGLLTLILVFSLVGGSLYLYKAFVEPRLATTENKIDTLPVDLEAVQEGITPKIEVFSTKAQVTFETPVEALGAVKFCLKNDRKSCESIAETKLTKEHLVELKNLKSTTDYEYKIIIDGTEYPQGISYFTFKTTANAEQTSPEIIANFEKAIESQDLNYDYNNDKKVTILDYRFYQKN